jgi:hypothetical protein
MIGIAASVLLAVFGFVEGTALLLACCLHHNTWCGIMLCMTGITVPVLLAVFAFVQGTALLLVVFYFSNHETWCDRV